MIKRITRLHGTLVRKCYLPLGIYIGYRVHIRGGWCSKIKGGGVLHTASEHKEWMEGGRWFLPLGNPRFLA